MAGKYVAYSEYKDSGVEWLGEIPSAWNVCRVKNIAELNPSKSELKNQPDDYLVSFLPMETIGEQGELDCTRVKKLSDVIGGYTYLADGDAFVAKITPCFENGKGAVAKDLVNGVGFATTEVIPLRPFQKGDSQFIYYLLHCDPFMALAEGSMYGAGGQKRVADSFVAEYHLALPELSERSAIANFLDHETAKIDTLIEEQKTLIRLLQEKRQAVISHAVTKGLPSITGADVPMKDSGVEWLGEVPEHWEVSPLKYLVRHKSGIQMGPFGGMLKDLEYTDTGFKLYGQENTISGDFSKGRRWLAQERYNELSNYNLAKGDIVLTRKGSLGNARLIENLQTPGIIDSDTIRVRVNPVKLKGEFLSLLMHEAHYIAEQIQRTRRGSVLPGLNSETIANLKILAPSLKEQDELVAEIKRLIEFYDHSLDECFSKCDLLQERRTALISAAVTGKIDVRDWAAPTPVVARQQEQQTTEAVE